MYQASWGAGTHCSSQSDVSAGGVGKSRAEQSRALPTGPAGVPGPPIAAPPPITYLSAQSLAAPTNCLDWLQQCTAIVCLFHWRRMFRKTEYTRAREMAQSAAELCALSSIIHGDPQGGRREPTPPSCPWTSTCAPWFVCTHI